MWHGARGEMNGLIVLNQRTGALLYSKAHVANFGLPDPGGHGIDPHSLAGLFFALELNAREATDSDDEFPAAGSSSRSEEIGKGLRYVEMGDAAIHIRTHDPTGVLLAMFTDAIAMKEPVGARHADSITVKFVENFAKYLALPAVSSKKFAPFTAMVTATIAETPFEILKKMVSVLRSGGIAGCHWAYAAVSSDLMKHLDGDLGGGATDDSTMTERSNQDSALAVSNSLVHSFMSIGLHTFTSVGSDDSFPKQKSVSFLLDGPQSKSTVGGSAAYKATRPSKERRSSTISLPKNLKVSKKYKKWWAYKLMVRKRDSHVRKFLGNMQYLYQEDSTGFPSIQDESAMTNMLEVVRNAGKLLSTLPDANESLRQMEMVVKSPLPSAGRASRVPRNQATMAPAVVPSMGKDGVIHRARIIVLRMGPALIALPVDDNYDRHSFQEVVGTAFEEMSQLVDTVNHLNRINMPPKSRSRTADTVH